MLTIKSGPGRMSWKHTLNLAPAPLLCLANRKPSMRARDPCTSLGEKHGFPLRGAELWSWADQNAHMHPAATTSLPPGRPAPPPHSSPGHHLFTLEFLYHKTRILLGWHHFTLLLKPFSGFPSNLGKNYIHMESFRAPGSWPLALSPSAAALALQPPGLCTHCFFYLKSLAPQNFSWLSSSFHSSLRKVLLASST